jgi:hypothetical protein
MNSWELHFFGDLEFTRDRPTLRTPVGLACHYCDEPIRRGERNAN